MLPGGKRSRGRGAGVTPPGWRRISDSALWPAAARALSPPGAVRGDSEDTLPLLTERPRIAVDTALVPSLDGGPGLPMATLVNSGDSLNAK